MKNSSAPYWGQSLMLQMAWRSGLPATCSVHEGSPAPQVLTGRGRVERQWSSGTSKCEVVEGPWPTGGPPMGFGLWETQETSRGSERSRSGWGQRALLRHEADSCHGNRTNSIEWNELISEPQQTATLLAPPSPHLLQPYLLTGS